MFLNLFVVYLFRQRDCKKSLFFISPGWWIGKKQLFKVGLRKYFALMVHILFVFIDTLTYFPSALVAIL